ncbi:MAG: sulfur oxidation protein [Rhodospirillaceae bacterium BRH_c57]|nr:MAG: sulfur oxidation protein [Rhodospirillaceae bacterium BRH_c57]
MSAKPRVRVPSTAKKGEVFEIKTVISHSMESGQRKAADGSPIPRKIIDKFVCTYNGKEVMTSQWYGAVSANPYLEFFCTATESGTLEFTWHDEGGETYTATADIKVT